MEKKNMFKFASIQRYFLIAFISLFFLNGCGSNPDIQIDELISKTTSYDEAIHINNCGGKADSEQTKSRSFSTNIEGGIEIGVQQIVEGAISTKYSQHRSMSVEQKLVAPSGTNMEFVLRWYEEVKAGNVMVNGETGTYKANIPVAVEQISSQDLGCSGNTQIPTPASQTTTNTLMSQTEFIGEWLYQQSRAPMPAPAGENQVIFAHGDINNTGTCHVKEFTSGETVQGLGLGGFKLWLITGTPEYIKDVEAQLQNGAAAHAGTDCPYLP